MASQQQKIQTNPNSNGWNGIKQTNPFKLQMTTNSPMTYSNFNTYVYQSMFDNINPIEIVLAVLNDYPQIKYLLQSMDHSTVTSSRVHAIKFLTTLMDSHPQFIQYALIKLIKQKLRQQQQQVTNANSKSINENDTKINENTKIVKTINTNETIKRTILQNNYMNVFNFLRSFHILDRHKQLEMYDKQYDKNVTKSVSHTWSTCVNKVNNNILFKSEQYTFQLLKLEMSILESIIFTHIPTKYLVDNWTTCNLSLQLKQRIKKHLKNTRKFPVLLLDGIEDNAIYNNIISHRKNGKLGKEPPLKKQKLNVNKSETMPLLESISISCGYCETDLKNNGHKHLYRCGQCKIECYCNILCQSKHWNIHKLNCNITLETLKKENNRLNILNTQQYELLKMQQKSFNQKIKESEIEYRIELNNIKHGMKEKDNIINDKINELQIKDGNIKELQNTNDDLSNFCKERVKTMMQIESDMKTMQDEFENKLKEKCIECMNMNGLMEKYKNENIQLKQMCRILEQSYQLLSNQQTHAMSDGNSIQVIDESIIKKEIKLESNNDVNK